MNSLKRALAALPWAIDGLVTANGLTGHRTGVSAEVSHLRYRITGVALGGANRQSANGAGRNGLIH